MTAAPFTFDAPLTLLGAGPAAADDLDAALELAPTLVAADGGADTARALDKKITAIIGDLDSLTTNEYWRNSGTTVLRLDEQSTTDFEKCLYATAAPLTLAVGFLGGRVDHELAVMSALVRYAARPVVAVGPHDVVFHAPPTIALTLPASSRISIFPLCPVTGIRSAGLRWSLEGLTLSPHGTIGTSNIVDGPVALAFDGPGALILLPRAALGEAVRALSAPASRTAIR